LATFCCWQKVSVLQVYGKAYSKCDSLERDLKNYGLSRDPGYVSLDGYYAVCAEEKMIHFYRTDNVKYVARVAYPESFDIFPLFISDTYYVKLKDGSVVRLKRSCDLSKKIDKIFEREKVYEKRGHTFKDLHREVKKRMVGGKLEQ
jgi:hypothetical protein